MNPRGRPRTFDRDAVLQTALEIFWRKGYDATQLSELTSAMSIKPPSFYAAFGSKEQLFREVVARYLQTDGAAAMLALQQADHVEAAIAAMLQASVETALASPTANGCLLILGMVNCAPDNAALHNFLRQIRSDTIAQIRERLTQGQADGELAADANTAQLATFFFTVMQGSSLQARDGAGRDELMASSRHALCALAT